MKANELMVGDWVRVHAPYFKKNKAYRVVEVREHGYKGEATAHIELPDEDEEASMTGEFLLGIPITPDILEKNGFERRDDLTEDGFLPFILDRNDTEECYEVIVEWRDYYDNGAADAFNVEIVDECWKLHVGCGMKTYISTQDIIFVHELQHTLRLCGIDKEIVL